MIKLHNTLSRKTEAFKPMHDGQVKLYTCGPTVYDFAQLGNLRSFVFDDTLRRVLQANGLEVKHVMNITDVGHLASDMDEGEDKLEKGAAREGKSVWDVAQFYIDAFKNDMAALNILPPNGYHGKDGPYARATDFIAEQIEIIKILLEKEYAYQTEQAIYFDVQKLPDYGELTGQKLSEKEVGVREEVVTDANKHHPQDFALWFFLVGRFENHSMHWPSPWGDGFPGWHLECSAIIHKTLGDPIDIHTGGVDHIGTHHPNEMAQTEAAYGNKLAKYWMHNEFLLIDGKRMGKSLGNFFTLKDVIERGFEPMALRLLYLQAHYRSQQNFTWQAITDTQNLLQSLRAWADLRFQPKPGTAKGAAFFTKARQEILEAVNEDLNTPKALAALNAVIDEMDVLVDADQEVYTELLTFIDELLGLSLADSKDVSEEQKQRIQEREEARASKDWLKADEIRNQLLDSGIELRDTTHGPVWMRLHR